MSQSIPEIPAGPYSTEMVKWLALTGTGGYRGPPSFVIPINVATKVEAQLLAHRRIIRGRLGVGIQDVDQGMAAAFGLPRVAGALIDTVEPGTPAPTAGLKPGDVVTHIENREIERSAELAEYGAGLKPGAEALLHVVRDRKPQTVSIKTDSFDDPSTAALRTRALRGPPRPSAAPAQRG